MKAAVVPAINSTWEVKDVPTPEPAANQVLIKIAANCSDWRRCQNSTGGRSRRGSLGASLLRAL